jgi:TfoX/Sxy family transcriptional regulator of competence genes
MVTNPQRDAAQARLEELSVEYVALPGVDWGPMFGSTGLRVRGKVFAVAARAGGLLIKVPESHADELAESGVADRMVMAGRPRREWVLVPDDADDATWSAQLDAAYTYVDSITPSAT